VGNAAWRIRAGVLLFAAALAVHELRYALTGQPLDEHAHQYFAWLLPIGCALLTLGVVDFAARLAVRAGRGAPVSQLPAGVRWLALSSVLLAVFCTQEMAELLLAHGGIDPAESLVTHGGWTAAPLCLVAGAVVTALLRGARALLVQIAGRRARPRTRIAQARPRFALVALRRMPVLACNLAGRAPPSFVV